MKKNNKGFTLVELIVVIAIIGILAAVLIPSITGYIRKARFSNDEQVAGHMTTLVQAYCAENNINTAELTPNEIKTIILSDGQYDLVAKNTLWTFVWNKSTKKVQAMYFSDAVEAAGTIVHPEEVLKSGYYLIGKGETSIEQVVAGIRNFNGTPAQFTALLNKLDGTDFVSFKSRFESEFNPSNTLFINENGVYSGAATGGTVTKVLFGDNISYIPSFGDDYKLPATVSVPATIEFISEGAFINISSYTKLTFSSTPVFEAGFIYNETMLAANGGVQPISNIEVDYESKGIKLMKMTIGNTEYTSGSFVELTHDSAKLLIQEFKTQNNITSLSNAEFRVGYTEDYKINNGKLYTSKFVVKLYSNNKLVGYCSIYYRLADVKMDN